MFIATACFGGQSLCLHDTWGGISIDMESQYKPAGSDEWGEIRYLHAVDRCH